MSAVPSDDALVEALARSAVEQVAPEELPLFRATSEAYFADPSSLEPGRSRDDMLGFGVDAALVLVSPVALQVAKEVICGPDAERHLEAIRKYVNAGIDQVCVHQVGPDQEGFIKFYQREVLPKVKTDRAAA